MILKHISLGMVILTWSHSYLHFIWPNIRIQWALSNIYVLLKRTHLMQSLHFNWAWLHVTLEAFYLCSLSTVVIFSLYSTFLCHFKLTLCLPVHTTIDLVSRRTPQYGFWLPENLSLSLCVYSSMCITIKYKDSMLWLMTEPLQHFSFLFLRWVHFMS